MQREMALSQETRAMNKHGCCIVPPVAGRQQVVG